MPWGTGTLWKAKCSKRCEQVVAGVGTRVNEANESTVSSQNALIMVQKCTQMKPSATTKQSLHIKNQGSEQSPGFPELPATLLQHGGAEHRRSYSTPAARPNKNIEKKAIVRDKSGCTIKNNDNAGKLRIIAATAGAQK